MNTDSIPIISQGKSLYHLIKGNPTKAKEIRMCIFVVSWYSLIFKICFSESTFSKQCIIVSQIRSAVEAIGGDAKAAKKTR